MEQPGDLLAHVPVCPAGLLGEHLGQGVLGESVMEDRVRLMIDLVQVHN